MIIGLSGYAQSGKDTIASMLVDSFGFERVAFADPIRDLLYEMNPVINDNVHVQDLVNEYGWELAKKKPEVRRLLQELGVGARKLLNNDVWVTAAIRKMDGLKTDYVISDVRFKNEALMINQFGGHMWRVNRPNTGPVNGHISESEMDDFKFNGEINNDGSFDSLGIQLATLYGAARQQDIWNVHQVI